MIAKRMEPGHQMKAMMKELKKGIAFVTGYWFAEVFICIMMRFMCYFLDISNMIVGLGSFEDGQVSCQAVPCHDRV